MGRTNYISIHTFPLLVFLMVVALIGLPFIKFLFVAAVSIGAGAVLFYAFLIFIQGMDRAVDYFYEEK